MHVPCGLFLVVFWLLLRAGERAPMSAYLPTVAPPPSPERVARERAQAQASYQRQKAAWAALGDDPEWLRHNTP